jgi:sortase A
MLYPTFSNWWNNGRQLKAIASYQEKVAQISDDETQEILAKAYLYNQQLSALASPLKDYSKIADYEDILDITGTGIMGYITIPKINVQLPIYHGTSASVLNVAVGHLEGSSLPVGGTGTHAVLSAHRGLPSAKLFSDLDQLSEGDEFTITILSEVLTYRVDEISIVKPNEMEKLAIDPDEDYVTLMTCTPYGINSHRLLVRAKRTDTITDTTVNVTADAVQIDTMTAVPFIAAPLVLILLIYWFFGGKKKKEFPHADPLSVFETCGENSDTKGNNIQNSNNIHNKNTENELHKEDGE